MASVVPSGANWIDREHSSGVGEIRSAHRRRCDMAVVAVRAVTASVAAAAAAAAAAAVEARPALARATQSPARHSSLCGRSGVPTPLIESSDE